MSNRVAYRALIVKYEEPVIEIITSAQVESADSSGESVSGVRIEVSALWDTGAEVTCIKPSLWDKLQFSQPQLTEQTVIYGIGGNVCTDSVPLQIWLAPDISIKPLPVYVVDFPSDAELLIGMDIITMGDFAICNTDGKTSVSFAVPSFPDRIDFTAKAAAANKCQVLK